MQRLWVGGSLSCLRNLNKDKNVGLGGGEGRAGEGWGCRAVPDEVRRIA